MPPVKLPRNQFDATRFGLDSNVLLELKEKAIAAKGIAYCPYSHFRVGCALLTEDETIITGANVECASYNVGTCAERCALAKAVTEGYTKFKALAVSTDITPPASPCGMCRQFIREFCPLQMPIFMYDTNGDHVVKTLEDVHYPGAPPTAGSGLSPLEELADRLRSYYQ